MGIQLGNDNLFLYMQIYNYYKELIINGNLSAGSKLPSIRRCSAELSVSRTTAETAYMLLAADGFIISRPQSGFYVNDLSFLKRESKVNQNENKTEKNQILYDFTSANADAESFDFNLWRRYIKSALRQDDKLLSYGEPQGEYELRSALASYIGEKRNVVCNADNIVVGAGIQSLLHIICALWEGEKKISFSDNSFSQGISIFNDHCWNVHYNDSTAPIIYTAPSHINTPDSVMSVAQRLELISLASKNNSLIIEDDYDNEFSYFNRPAPSLQSLAGGHGVIYLGSFSRLLLPSIRISFMVLPPELLKKYRKIAKHYNQTASKTEQIALCQFIRDGHLVSQTRKLRKLYTAKSRLLTDAVSKVFGSTAVVSPTDSGLKVKIVINENISLPQLRLALQKRSTAVTAYTDENSATLLLSCTSIKQQYFETAAKALFDSIDECRK